MDKLLITGNGPLNGEVRISGAKNAALPSLAAGILVSDQLRLTNLPNVHDIKTMCQLLRELGLVVDHGNQDVTIDGRAIHSHTAPYELVKTMRASILALGPLVGRLGHARVSLPGGCAIGERPVDMHLSALEQMGAEINLEHGYIEAKAERLRGADITFRKVTVTGTENLMMAASLAQGTTILRNAALEPEVGDLGDLLNKMGAKISGHGTDTIVIEGVRTLHGADHRIVPDRIETGTYICAAAITNGHVVVTDTAPEFLRAFIETMRISGLDCRVGNDHIEVLPHRGLIGHEVVTNPHPGFPTDMQAQFMAVMTQAEGATTITESIFENRFMHVAELNRMGADIRIDDRTAVVHGPSSLSGAQVMATDLRASASLVVAALVADGTSTIDRIYHLDRGYTDLEEKLKGIGAIVERSR